MANIPFKGAAMSGLLWGIIVYLSVWLYAWGLSDSMIFQPPKPSSYTQGELIIPLPNQNQEYISALYLKHPYSKTTVLYSHGNAEDIGGLRPYFKALFALGVSVLAYDYRGYGLSKGRVSETHTYEDIEAVYHYLTKEQKIPADQIIIHGRSLGTGPSCHLAAHFPIKGLILESPFISAFRVQTIVPLLPFDKFRNHRCIQKVKAPILYIHGKKDTLIPIWHTRKLSQLGPKNHFIQWIDEAGHNDLVSTGGPTYWNALKQFIDHLP